MAELIERVDTEKIAEENPNSRFRVTNVAILNPGVCFVCGSAGGDDRQFVDFGKTQDFYGVVYICTYCVAEVARVLGLTNNDEQIVIAHNEIVEQYNELLKNSQEMENAFRSVLRHCHCEPVIGGEPQSLVYVETDPESESPDPDVDESSDIEGPGDVPETSSNDEPPTSKRRRATKSDE